MSMIIAHNMSAVNTVRNFSVSSRGMSSAMEKLSSGYKINTGKDDPSGLVISEKLRAQELGLQRAKQNTEEAMNVIGIAEGALNETNNILKKMKQLAVHAASDGVTSPEQIAADQTELDSSIQTTDHIARTTKYSNQTLLAGGKAISFDSDTNIQGTQNNKLLDVNSSHVDQIFRRDNYSVAISFTGTKNADSSTAIDDVDFSKQAMKAYLEVDSAKGTLSQVDENGYFTQKQSFILTGSKGSRAFNFDKGTPVSEMVSQIHNTAGSTGVDAALVFNGTQRIDRTVFPPDPPEPEPIVGQLIDIRGLMNVDADPVELSFPMDGIPANTLRKALEDAGQTGLSFRIDVDNPAARTLKLIAIDSDDHEYELLTGWDGSPLGGARPGIVTTVDGDQAVAEAMKGMQLHTSDAIVPEQSVIPSTLRYDWTDGGPTLIAENLYNNTAYGAQNPYPGQGTMDFDIRGLNWGSMFDHLPEDKKKDFYAAAMNGTLQLEVDFEITDNQETLAPTFRIFDTAKMDPFDPSKPLVYFEETYTRSQLGISNVTGTTSGTVTISSGLFAGARFSLTDSKENIGYKPGTSSSVNIGSIARPSVSPGTETVSNPVFTAPGTYSFPVSGQLTVSFPNTVNSLGTPLEFSLTLNDPITFNALLSAKTFNSSTDLTFELRASGSDFSGTVLDLYIIDADGTEYKGPQWTSAGGTAAYTSFVPPPSDPNSLAVAAELMNLSSIGSAARGNLNGRATLGSSNVNYSFTTSSLPTTTTFATGLYGPTADEGTLTFGVNNINWNSIYSGLSTADKQLFLDSLHGVGHAVGNAGFEVVMDPGSGSGLLHENFTPTFKLVSKADPTMVFAQYTHTGINRADGTSASTFGLWGGTATLNLTDIKANYGYRPGNTMATADVKTLNSSNLYGYLRADSATTESPRYYLGASIVVYQQQGGVAASGTGAVREVGSPAIFNNIIDPNGSGRVLQGVTALDFAGSDVFDPPPGATSIQYSLNTDGQGRIYVKFLDDKSFELYKDASLTEESKVVTGISGQEISACNNSGLKGLILHLNGQDLRDVKGVYMTFAGVEGESYVPPPIDRDGVVYGGDVISDQGAVGPGGRGTMSFEAERTLITGVQLGVNTTPDGKIYTKSVYNADTHTVQLFAYMDECMRDEDLVAKSQPYTTMIGDDDVGSMTVILNEVRNDDNTLGTGLGIVVSMSGPAFRNAESTTMKGTITFTNLGARVFAEEYGSDHFVKVNQTTGGIFTYYGSPGDARSQTLIDAGSTGKTVQINGQDASLSLNGTKVTSNGLDLNVATQDLQVRLKFREGKVGSTTIAQVGYGEGLIFTKIGALTLGSAQENADGLSGLLCNAGHVTTESMGDFQNGMQLQLGESSGDQDRTVVSIQSMTMDALGRITKGGYWEAGKSIYSERVFTLQDVLAGGKASLTGDALLAMEIIEQSINDVTGLRARLGAIQSNLLQTNSNNLDIMIENIQKNESGIRDADMVVSMSEFTKNQVLQGAGTAMLTQIRQLSQNVLQLLQ